MAGKSQYVTIPLEEYKELLLKDKPTDKDHELAERMIAMVSDHLEYDGDASEWQSGYVSDGLVAKGNGLVKDIVTMLKYVDFERYMEIWNSAVAKKRSKDAMDAKIAQMNAAKEIRSDSR